jgi:hypothetical protein
MEWLKNKSIRLARGEGREEREGGREGGRKEGQTDHHHPFQASGGVHMVECRCEALSSNPHTHTLLKLSSKKKKRNCLKGITLKHTKSLK